MSDCRWTHRVRASEEGGWHDCRIVDPIYFPAQGLVDRRNLANRDRARSAPYNVPAGYCTAETTNLIAKFHRRCTPDGWFRCYLCGCPIGSDAGWHLDHVHPLALGGTHEDHNVEAACPRCNLTKGKLTLDDFLGSDVADEWRRRGWPPPVERMSSKPVEELWRMDPGVARRFARRPREVPVNASARWGTAGGWRYADR
ncbi:MAG: HNH endonuclease [Acidobacteriota bacterium]|nr:HNH endonuclease [Acidobacteriota bacterium]